MNYEDMYNDPIIGKKRKGTPDSPYQQIEETLQVINGKAVLTETPNRFQKVIVSDNANNAWFEVNGESTGNQYKVDYSEGVVFFDLINNGKSLTFTYLGEGTYYYPAHRVYIEDGDLSDNYTPNVKDKFVQVDTAIIEQKARVDEQIRSVPQPSEVVDMRIDHNGNVFTVAKDRIDAEQIKIEEAYRDNNGMLYDSLKHRINGEQIKIEEAYRDKNNVLFPSLKDRIDSEQTKIEEASVGVTNIIYSSLKERLDAEYTILKNNLDRVVNVKALGAVGDGVTDDTEAIQAALNIGGTIVFPQGTYYAGALVYKSNSIIKGLGNVVIAHNPLKGYVSPFPRAMITNANLPTYRDPSSTNREYVVNVVRDVVIENITFDGKGQAIWGVQSVAVDNLFVRNVKVKNTKGALDLRAVRDCVINLHADGITDDGISVTDQNFKTLTEVGHRGITKNIVFENCIVENSCLSNSPSSSTGDSAYEMDDGMQFVYFNNCVARNNKGVGFQIHLHTSEYDMEDIFFNNCIAENNTPPSSDYLKTIAGFQIGQTPLGSTFTNIYFNNCISVGSPNAFALSPGSQVGNKGDIYINGGKWINSNWYTSEGTTGMNNTTILLKKEFRNVVINDAIIKGNPNGFGIYTYEEGDGLTVNNCTFIDMYVPLRAGHFKGAVIFKDNIVNSKADTSAVFSAFMYFNVESAIVKGNIFTLNSVAYSSSIIRFVQVGYVLASDNIVINNGTLGNNAFQVDTCVNAIVHNNIIKNFATGIYLSNSSTSVIIHDNDCKTCTNVTNNPDAEFLIIHHNASSKSNNYVTWQNITLINNWSTQNTKSPRFKVYEDGEVRVSFAIGGGALGTVIGYIPVDYAPKRLITAIGYTSSAAVSVSITIDTTGAIIIPSANNASANTSYIALEFAYDRN